MVDLRTTYLGLKLKNPIVASASPLSEKEETVRALEDAGIAAIVMYSLFEEYIIRESLELDHFLNSGTDSFAEVRSFLPDLGRYALAPDVYLERIAKFKKAVNIPIIGSLNGVSSGGWLKYAQKIEQAGADALELNLYYLPTNPDLTATDIENNYIQLVKDITAVIKIPLAVKLSPFFTALPNFSNRVVQAGAKGLVLFNRFYQPDFDTEKLTVIPTLHLSTSEELNLPLHWIAILFGQIKADLALTSGAHTSIDVLKGIMAGANIVTMASALLNHGPNHVAETLAGLQTWMQEHKYESITQMKGSMSQRAVTDPAAFERVNYIKVLESFQIR